MNDFSSLRDCSENHCHCSIIFLSVRIELMTDGYKRYVMSAQHHSSCWIDNKILNGLSTIRIEYTINVQRIILETPAEMLPHFHAKCH